MWELLSGRNWAWLISITLKYDGPQVPVSNDDLALLVPKFVLLLPTLDESMRLKAREDEVPFVYTAIRSDWTRWKNDQTFSHGTISDYIRHESE